MQSKKPDWRTKQRRDEKGEPQATFWFAKAKVSDVDKEALRAALKHADEDESDVLGFEPTTSSSFPTSGNLTILDATVRRKGVAQACSSRWTSSWTS